ncbi:patatin-like phospholipase family protein [Hyphomicrobium sp.]|jgi:NTE family protein|uniref:patatin-like phospholipase family protein n=1 Tax=Hyphomicrobium sp. TaxID=82 RepID=UPI002C106332|nr:patatin-like phospholipase family protein [Hyphomicrobium sp.]HVZ03792.1 patatin-like phospholipase family protein [Hyphomicrobium sp.]
MSKGKFALALGGGAARGWAHIGVLRALEDAGLPPDIVVGTSIGAIVGGHFAGGRLDRLEEFARELTKRRVFGYLDLSVSGSGLIAGQRLFDRFDDHLNGLKIENLPMRFAAIATDLSTGHEIWLRQGCVNDAVRASSAIPGIVRPVRLNGRWLVDGCLVNPIPVSVCRALGARTVVAVNLTSEFGRGGILVDDAIEDIADEPVIEQTAPITRWNGRGALQLLHRQLFGHQKETAPGITSVILNSFSIFHDRIARARLMGDPPDLLLSPDLAHIGVLDFHRAEEMIAAGRAAVEPHIPIIERYLGESKPTAMQSRLFSG